MGQWGIQDNGLINDALTCWIQQAGDVVVGVIGEGTSLEVTANWESPFEDSSLGSMFKKVGGAVQKITDKTSLTTLASSQVWGGNEPYLYDLVLKFYALNDPWTEVEGAIVALQKMIAPEVNQVMPGGRVPLPVYIILGKTFVPTGCHIKSVSINLDKERDGNGNLVRAEVNVQVGTIQMVNKSDIH